MSSFFKGGFTMRILRMMTRIISGLSISLLLPLVLLLPVVAFANGGGGKNLGALAGAHYGYLDNGNQNGGGDNQGGDNQGGDNQGGGGGAPAGVGPGGAGPAVVADPAPEINMASINSAMALLVGGAMWLRHRK